VVVLENIQSYVDEIAAKGLLYKPMKRKRGKNRSRKRKTAGGAKNGHCGPVTPSRRLTQLEIDEVGSHDGFLMFRRGNVSWGDFTCRSREIDDEIEMAYFTRSLQSQELPTGPHDDQELGEQDRALSLVGAVGDWHAHLQTGLVCSIQISDAYPGRLIFGILGVLCRKADLVSMPTWYGEVWRNAAQMSG